MLTHRQASGFPHDRFYDDMDDWWSEDEEFEETTEENGE